MFPCHRFLNITERQALDIFIAGTAVAVVKVLRYKSEGRWFDPRWGHWNFFVAYNVIHAVARWLRCCATNRKVAGSIPDGVFGIFH
jgi:hypothetical protein